jgi:hypothetical protein
MGDADITYTAVYSETKRKYTITFKDEDGTTLKSVSVDYGTNAATLLANAPALSKASNTECKTYV